MAWCKDSRNENKILFFLGYLAKLSNGDILMQLIKNHVIIMVWQAMKNGSGQVFLNFLSWMVDRNQQKFPAGLLVSWSTIKGWGVSRYIDHTNPAPCMYCTYIYTRVTCTTVNSRYAKGTRLFTTDPVECRHKNCKYRWHILLWLYELTHPSCRKRGSPISTNPQLSYSNKNLVLGPRCGLISRLDGWLTVGHTVTLTLKSVRTNGISQSVDRGRCVEERVS
jgi:hypothetical protein